MSNNFSYINDYKREHYVRKEVCFKKEEWQKVEQIIKEEKKSLKTLIIEKIVEKNKNN